MNKRTSSDELSEIFTPLERSANNLRTLKPRKSAGMNNDTLTEQNLEGLYNVNTDVMAKSVPIGNVKNVGKINWSKELPAVEGQRAAANPSPPPGKPFGILPFQPYGDSPPTVGGPTYNVVGGRRSRSRFRAKSRKSKKSKKSRKQTRR